MISRDTIDRIFDAAHIEEVVGEFVQLKKAGSNFKGLSPWSNEKTPSFFVSPAKGIFKDFSSGKGGNVVSFLMELENMSYPEALRYLGERYQIEVEETQPDPSKMEEVSLRESLTLVNSFAAEYFIESLWKSDEGKSIGLSYFRERGFNDKTIEKFALGYASDQNNALLNKATEAGHNINHLLKLGLIKAGDYGNYDFFRSRVIFPIRNVSGRYIAFAGRTLKSDNKVKYLNSPESELYDKSSSLYGIFEAKRAMIQHDACFLVEGYTDVISLHQAGIEYAVASSGTSLTPGQIQQIKRYTKNVTLLYDGDPAGMKASLRGIDLLLEQGMNVKVVLFPEGHDPDSFAQSVSNSELERYLSEEAVDFTDFMVEVLLRDAADDPIKKTEATRRIVQSLSNIADYIARSVYVERCSRKLGVPEQALLNELNKLLRKKQLQNAGVNADIIPKIIGAGKEGGAERPKNDPERHEKEIARILLNYGNRNIDIEIEDENDEKKEITISVAEYILTHILDDEIEFHSPVYAWILSSYISYFEDYKVFPEAEYFVKDLDPKYSEAIAGIITSPYELSANWSERHHIYTETEEQNLKRAVFDPLMRLKLLYIKTLIQKIEEELKLAENEADMTALLQQENIKLTHMQNEVAAFFGMTFS